MKTISKSGLKVNSAIKAGGMAAWNHTRSGLKVKAGIRAGAGIDLKPNHNVRLYAAA